MLIQIIKDKYAQAVRVEIINDDDKAELAVFYGENAHKQASAYAEWLRTDGWGKSH